MAGMSNKIDGLNFHNSEEGWTEMSGLGQINPREWEFFKQVYPDYTQLFKIDIEGHPHPEHSYQDAMRLNNAVAEVRMAMRWQDKSATSGLPPAERAAIHTDAPEQRTSSLGFGSDFDAGPIPTGEALGFWNRINKRR